VEVTVGDASSGGLGGDGGTGGQPAVGAYTANTPVSGNMGKEGAQGFGVERCGLGTPSTGEISCWMPPNEQLGLGEPCQTNAQCAGYDTTLHGQPKTECSAGADGSATSRCAPYGMNYIAAGSYHRGASVFEVGSSYTDSVLNVPINALRHPVVIARPFFISRAEETQDLWTAVKGSSANLPGNASRGQDPQVSVSWFAVAAYANARSAAEGATACYTLTGCTDPSPTGWGDGVHSGCTGVSLVGPTCDGFRLPTEAEWEYAARAGTTDAGFWGPTPNSAYLWDQVNSKNLVGTKLPNSWGLYDVQGNVNEFTQDTYAPYPTGAVDPGLAARTIAESGGTLFVRRGGDHLSAPPVGLAFEPIYKRSVSAAANGNTTASNVAGKDPATGFRLVRSVKPTPVDGSCPPGFVVSAGGCIPAGQVVSVFLPGTTTVVGQGLSQAGSSSVSDLICNAGYIAKGSLCLGDLGTLCVSDAQCQSGYCTTQASGTANDRCAAPRTVYIPAGSFRRASDSGTSAFTISRPFLMDETETTRGDWMVRTGGGVIPYFSSASFSNSAVGFVDQFAVASYANARSIAEGLPPCYTINNASTNLATDSWFDGRVTDGVYISSSSQVMTSVSTYQGVQTRSDFYASFRQPLECEGYRLPTEMEWEYAARAGTTTAYPWGDSAGASGLNWGLSSGNLLVKQGSANPWGLYDMFGNVAEWTGGMGYFPGNNDPAALPAYPADGGANTVDYEGSWLAIPDITVSCNNTVSRVVWRGLASANASTPYNAFPSLLGCADSRRRNYGDLGFRLVRTVVRAPSAGGCAGAFHFNATTATCEPDQRACLSAGISGFQSWDGIQFGACTKCPVGSVAQGTECAPVASRTVESGPNVCGTTGLVTGLTLATNTVNGTLTSGDSIGGFRDSASAVVNTRSDKYSVTLLAGETMVATLRNPAGDMDPYLLLDGDATADGVTQCGPLATDNDGGRLTAARITFRAPVAGTYYLVATTNTLPASTGSISYDLVVTKGLEIGEACTADNQCASSACSLGQRHNGTAATIPTALKVCVPNQRQLDGDLVLIPAGSFVMGSPLSEMQRSTAERQQKVTITRPFYLSRLEATQRAVFGIDNPTGSYAATSQDMTWWSMLAYANARSDAEGLEQCYASACLTSAFTAGNLGAGCTTPTFVGPTCTGYRLPTDAEWEYAARAGTTGATYNAGVDGQSRAANNALILMNDGTSVGYRRPNAWGLYDMFGGQWELAFNAPAALAAAANYDDPFFGIAFGSTDAGLSSGVVTGQGLSYEDTASGSLLPRAAYRVNGGWPKGTNYTASGRLARTAVLPKAAGVACPANMHESGNLCDVNSLACALENASAASRTWNADTASFGSCSATACASGYHLEGASGSQVCVANMQACSSATGVGTTSYNPATGLYAACKLPLAAACLANGDCESGNCATTPEGTANDRCAPAGMNFIPGGTYLQGSPQTEAGRNAAEIQRTVTITRPFFMGRTEVTQAEWNSLAAVAGGSTTFASAFMNWNSAVGFANARSVAENLTPCYTERQPSNGLTYEADWRAGGSDLVIDFAGVACTGYRLPTQAEWQYAARAGTTGANYATTLGAPAPTAAQIATISNQPGYTGLLYSSQPIAQKAPNAWGLYDMLANVGEFGNDWTGYTAGAVTDPTGPATGSLKPVLGYLYPNLLPRAASFENFTPNYRGWTAGIRLVRSAVHPKLQLICPTGFHDGGAACEPDVIGCAPTGAGTISGNATWNGSSYGSCIPTGCATGYHVEGGLCLTNEKTCTVGASTGVQSWSSGSTYGDCKLALGSLCTGNIDCASGRCATGPAGTANDRCAPAGMNYIPSGTYIMGSPATETGRQPDETQHQVTITRPFFLGEKEVTQAEWTARSGGTNPSCFQTTTGTTCTTSNANPTGPVELVDWRAAMAYANGLSEAEGLPTCYDLGTLTSTTTGWGGGTLAGAASPLFAGVSCAGYRLPTESEWEYAARAGTTGATFNAANPLAPTTTEINAIAWNAGNAGSRTQAAGQKLANNFGLFDVFGNVWEWTYDSSGTYPGTVADPLGVSPTSNTTRILRGAAWNNPTTDTRAARRTANSSTFNVYGFRLARTAVLPAAQSACPTGYHLNGATCDPDVVDCAVANAAGAKQTWDGSAYGLCTITSCTGATTLQGNECVGYCSSSGATAVSNVSNTAGTFANTDPTNGPRGAGFYYDRYAVTLTAGQVITVTQTANTGFFDTLLYLYGGASCGQLAVDDDSAGSGNSRIIFTAPAAGTYYLLASHYYAGNTGTYTLTVGP
jgi:formylglycine-generating enzyme required for sulfatase activity